MKTIRFRRRDLAQELQSKWFLTLFLAGFVTGVLYLSLFGRAAVRETTLMSAYFFSKYRYLESASEELFLHCLKARLSSFAILWLAGLTVVGSVLVYLYLFWLGASFGITVTVAAMKLGAQGILICIAGGLPQFVLYVPAGVWMLRRICRMAGKQEPAWRQWKSGKKLFYRYLGVLAAGIVLFFLGAFLESYVNPLFLKTFLKKL